MNSRRTASSNYLSISLIMLLLLLNIILQLSGIKIFIKNGVPKISFKNIQDDEGFISKRFFSENGLREYSKKVHSHGFLDEAVRAFEEYIKGFPEESKERAAGVFYSFALDYLNNHNFKNALMCLLKAELSAPDNELMQDIYSKQMVCLEKLGKTSDAKNLLSKLKNLKEDEETISSGDKNVLAVVGDFKITQKMFENDIKKLSVLEQETLFKNKEKKIEHLKKIVFMRLLYNKALRLGMDQDEEFIKKFNEMKLDLLTRTMLEAEIGIIDTPSETILNNYYAENENYFKDPISGALQSLDEIRDDAINMYLADKENEKINKVIGDTLQVEDVRIFEENFDE